MAENGFQPDLEMDRPSQLMVVRSTDHGTTWSKPENRTTKLNDPAWHLFSPTPGNEITMRDDTLVMPTQTRDENLLPFSNIHLILILDTPHSRNPIANGDDTGRPCRLV